jgi:sarcosine oxidase subunit beta
MTPDGSPIVGWSRELQGHLLAVGMCGQGYMLGPGLGEMLARLVTNSAQPEDSLILDTFSPYRSFEGQETLK